MLKNFMYNSITHQVRVLDVNNVPFSIKVEIENTRPNESMVALEDDNGLMEVSASVPVRESIKGLPGQKSWNLLPYLIKEVSCSTIWHAHHFVAISKVS